MAELLLHHSWLVVVLPAVFAVAGLLLCRYLPWRLLAWSSVAINGITALWAIALAITWLRSGGDAQVAWQLQWFPVTEGVSAAFGALIDPISVMMLLVITTVSTLVHLYSIGYMAEDPGAGRFFPLLSLFSASMIGLVIATGLLQLFVCWELVGLTSYLLIGFWYRKPAAVAASKKAFIITRFADAFFLAGLILLTLAAGSTDFAVLLGAANLEGLAGSDGQGTTLLAWGSLLVFVGAWGKSAMFPMHVWLPDAMEGPTPVSSIIHSATMVVAGIYLVARLFPLLAIAPDTRLVIETTGIATALFAALVACFQTDFKRVLAFSTLSQLGYMMFALGTADASHPQGYTAAMFHVFTHAFFKCLLFLLAGIVIHAVHHGDITRMGGLRRRLPVTWILCALAGLALSGLPPLSGFFSKDAILIAAWEAGHHLSAGVGLAVGLLSAFYMGRLFLLVFHGPERGDPAVHGQVHEPRLMLISPLLLAIPTVTAGWLGGDLFAAWVRPPGVEAPLLEHHPLWLPALASLLALLGLLAAWWRHGARSRSPGAGRVAAWLARGCGIDSWWSGLARRLAFPACQMAKVCDERVIDASLDAGARGAQGLGRGVRALQSGHLQSYALILLLGVVAAVLWRLLS